MNEWYYVQEGKQLGPISEEDLSEKLKEKTLPNETKVWKEGMDDWVSASDRNNITPTEPEILEQQAPTPLKGAKMLQILSLLACLICLLNPFAAFAFVYILQAKNAHGDQRTEDAQRKLTLCKRMLFIAFLTSLIIYALLISVFMGWITLPML